MRNALHHCIQPKPHLSYESCCAGFVADVVGPEVETIDYIDSSQIGCGTST